MTFGARQKMIALWEETYPLHEEIVQGMRDHAGADLTDTLTACQEIAIQIGNSVEEAALDKAGALVHLLESYCEQIYQISVISKKEHNSDACKQILSDYEETIAQQLGMLPIRTEIVFFPYKASMWDALESVWREAVQDERCDVYVVPIPYCDKNPDGSAKEWHYEGGFFPEYVPITAYDKYAIEAHMPDVAYIHNPYDGYNLVTSVAPAFYSSELKKYVRKLVYIPYFYAGATLSDHQSTLPAYENIDYVVLPGEMAVERMRLFQPDQKLLPFGSPKIDRMLLMDGHGSIPEEWRELAKNRTVVLYNVGLSPMLQNRYRSIEKMRVVFNVFKGRSDVLLWWRPHPLIKASLQSIAPELLGAYEELEREFLLERIGIYDTGPDSNLAVASTDAFIGDYSSMIYMFGVTGKPIFYLNNYILEDRAKHRDVVCITDFSIDADGKLVFASAAHDLTCVFDPATGHIEARGTADAYRPDARKTLLSADELQLPEKKDFSCMNQDGNEVWMAARDGSCIARLRTETGEYTEFDQFPPGFLPYLSAFVTAGSCVFSHIIVMEAGVYVFPGTANMVLVVNRQTGEIQACDWKLPYLEGQRKGSAFAMGNNYLCAKKYDAHTIAAVTAYDYSILMIDTESDEVRICDSRLSSKDMARLPQAWFMRAVLLGGQPPYIVWENGLTCCLNDFLDDVAAGGTWSKEKQKTSFEGYTNNLDGTCGAKTHHFIMDKLEEEKHAAI